MLGPVVVLSRERTLRLPHHVQQHPRRPLLALAIELEGAKPALSGNDLVRDRQPP
jgi:hypothetical protein